MAKSFPRETFNARLANPAPVVPKVRARERAQAFSNAERKEITLDHWGLLFLRWAHSLFKINAYVLGAFALWVGLFFFGLVNLLGITFFLLVIATSRTYGLACRLLAVSLWPIGIMLYDWARLD